MKIRNFSGITRKTVNEAVEKCLQQEDWQYYWIAPYQNKTPIENFTGFSVSSKAPEALNMLKNAGCEIREARLLSENMVMHFLGGKASETRWSLWLGDAKQAKIPLAEWGERIEKELDCSVVLRKVCLRNSGFTSKGIVRGLGSSGIDQNHLTFSCCYKDGVLKCWFPGGKNHD